MLIRRMTVAVAFTFVSAAATTYAHDMHVVINEINYHPYGNVDEQEFIELFNRGTEAVDLSSWRLVSGVDFVFPAETILNPGAYLVVAKSPSTVANLYSISNVIGPFEGKLANEGEMVELVNAHGVLIERIHYSDDDPWNESPDGDGPSLERISVQEAGDRPWNWAASRFIGGTPGAANSVNALALPARDVVINEVASSAGDGWIELYNRSGGAINLQGYALVSEPFGGSIYTIADQADIPGGGYWSVSAAALPFAWSHDADQRISLLTPDHRLIDTLSIPTQAAAGSFGRVPDGTEGTCVMTSPSRDNPNHVTINHAIVINEIMYHPAPPSVPPGQPLLPYDRNEEFVELYNRSGGMVDLTGWKLDSAINYALPAGTQMAAGSYLVVARDPNTIKNKHGLTGGVVGGFAEILADGHERIVLRDALGNRVDDVTYADDGSWPTAPDGQGPSLELIQADMDNDAGIAWRASLVNVGTPGAANSTLVADPPPVIRDVRHDPPAPTSAQEVIITAQVSDAGGVSAVRLWSVVDPGTGFTSVPMVDDGTHGDGSAGDGVYGAKLPARSAGSIVRFYIEAVDDQSQAVTAPVFPPTYARAAASDPAFMYQVDNRTWPTDLPLYRVILTSANLQALRSRDLYSNVDLDGTFISGQTIIYNVGVRYRGQGSRTDAKKSFRVQFHDDHPWGSLEDLNLNAHNPHQQYIGQEFFSYVDLPVHRTRVVLMTLDNDLDMSQLPDPNTYAQVESVNETYLERVFGDDSTGNLYRADRSGDMSYLGADPAAYREFYLKQTNEDLDDFSDIIALTDLLTNTPDAQFADVVRANVDIDQWMRFFASMTVVTNDEGGICLDTGDDYFLYRRPSDQKWLMIPWDFDSVWDLSATRSPPDQRLFRAGINDAGGITLPIVRRILRHPDFAPIYYREIRQMMAYSFHPAIMADRLTNLRRYLPHFLASDIDDVESFVTQRRSFLDSVMPTDLTVGLDEATRPRLDLIVDGDSWKFFRGTAEPSAGSLNWTHLDFADQSWETGPSGFGYGDNDDRTTLSNMQNNYTSVYIRRQFVVDDLSHVPELTLGVWYDDGFVAYLNGKEVARRNVTGTADVPVARDGTAAGDHEAADSGFEAINLTSWLTAPNALLVQGANVLAVQGLNRAANSSDFSLRPELYVPGVGAPTPRIVHIADGAQWSFFRGRSEPSAQSLGWTQLNFTETGWETGPSGFGYGDNDDLTVLTDMQNNYASVYIRKKFVINDLSSISDLLLEVLYDDGFIAYINGQEVARGSVTSTIGQPVAHDNYQVVGSHEASAVESFDLKSLLTNPNSPLHAGENVLAVQGLNATLGSADFSLRPKLSSSGKPGSVVSECGQGLVTGADTLHLSGVAPAGDARWVRINGQTASYQPVSWDNSPLSLSAYTAQASLQPGPNDVEIVALDADLIEVARRKLSVVRTVDTSTAVAGVLAASTTWTQQGGPYHITADAVVPVGGLLSIEAGTDLLFDVNATLVVLGRLLAHGTAEAPIRFQPFACGQNWTGVIFLQSQGESRLDYCQFFDGSAPTYQSVSYSGCINAVASSVRMEHAWLERMGARAVDAIQNASLVMMNSTCTELVAGLHIDHSYAHLEGLLVSNVLSGADAIEFNGDASTQSVVRNCLLDTGGGCGLRVLGNSALIEGNTISRMASKGILLQGPGQPVLRSNIVANCPTGLALADGVNSTISHCTLAGGQTGIDALEMNAGAGGGHGVADSTIIWNYSTAAIRLDGLSAVTIQKSDIAGGFAGAGNIAADPLFVDGAAGNYYLAPNSPCVGTGVNGTDMGALPAAGNPVYQVVINEWMAKNSKIADPQGEYDDWFELYNAGPSSVDVGGLYLSDHFNNPGLWRIPTNTVLAPKSFQLIWADRDVTDVPGMHADFALDIAGEEIGLYLKAGGTYHVIDRVVFAAQTADVSMGRTTDGSEQIGLLDHPTPGRSNNPPPPLSNGVGLRVIAPSRFLPAAEVPVRIEVLTPWRAVDKDVWSGQIQLATYPPDAAVTPASVEVVNGIASAELHVSTTGPVRLTATFGARTATVELVGLDAPAYHDVSGTLPSGTTVWSPANGIVRVNGDLTVPTGAVLQIDAGAMVVLNSAISMTVAGSVQCNGTLAEPVLITATDSTAPWGQILLTGSASTSAWHYALLTRGGNSPGVGHTGFGPVIRGTGGATAWFADSTLIDEYGKGMYVSGCHMTLDRCLLSRMVMGMEVVDSDAAITDTFYVRMEPGGDVSDHDALYLNGSGNMVVQRCVFAFGGDEGIDTLSSTPRIEHCIIHGFEDKGISVYSGTTRVRDSLIFSTAGGGISAKGNNTDVYLDNCTVFSVPIGLQARDKFGEPNNIIHYFVNNTIIWAATQTVQTDYQPANIVIGYSILDPSVPWAGTGNTTADPRFRDSAGFDFRLQDDSPGVNTGDPSFIPVAGETDLDGQPRVLASRVDRGAYEFAVQLGDGDSDGDGDVDQVDFGYLQACWTGSSNTSVSLECSRFDFDLDGRINLEDLRVFAACYSGPAVPANPACAHP